MSSLRLNSTHLLFFLLTPLPTFAAFPSALTLSDDATVSVAYIRSSHLQVE